MFNVCPQCGEYCVEKTIDVSGPYAICPSCNYAHPFLQQRPEWRKSNSEDFIAKMMPFNHWLKENATRSNPPMTLYDNSQQSLEGTTKDIAQWIRGRI